MIYAFFGPDGRLDRSAMRRQMEAFVHSGVHGIAVLGIVTEFNKLDVNERRTIIEWSAEDLAGRLPLAVTINEPSVGGQIEIARLAAEVNADWLILQPPINRNVPESELVGFLGKVADAATLPVAIQKTPLISTSRLSFDALNDLRRNHGNIVLLKGEGPIEYVRSAIEETDGAFRVFNGRGGFRAASIFDWLRRSFPTPDCADVLAQVYDLFRQGDATAEPRRKSCMRAFFRCSLSLWRRPSICCATANALLPPAWGYPKSIPGTLHHAVGIWSGDRLRYAVRLPKLVDALR